MDGKEVKKTRVIILRVGKKLFQIYRKNWMFSLVGSESFNISSRPAEIVISCKGQLIVT